VLVRDPNTKKPLDATGEWKPHTAFWTRRLRDGDVRDETEAQLAREAAVTPAAAKKAKSAAAGA
jgi:hypothetical protein